MSSTGAGYDLSATTFSPDGKIFQVEYATKAVENSGTVIGVKCKDGILLAVEKLLPSKLLVPGSNKRIYRITPTIGAAVAGLVADSRQIINRAREEAADYKENYGENISPSVLANRVSSYVHYFTVHGSLRPFGVSTLIAGYDDQLKESHLYMVEPSGVSYRYFGCAIGKGRQGAKTEIEKNKFGQVVTFAFAFVDLLLRSARSPYVLFYKVRYDYIAAFDGKYFIIFPRSFGKVKCRDALKYVAKILHLLHDDTKDKPFQLEMSWLCEETNFQHETVPAALISEAERWALESIEQDEMED